MKRRTFSSSKGIFTLAIIAFGIAAATGCSDDPVAAAPADVVDGVYKPDAKPFGKTYVEWAQAWWQWNYGTAATDASGKLVHPLLDSTGANCAIGQNPSSPVFFLGGMLNSSGTFARTCTIPSGKALFFPIVNGLADTIGTPQWTVDSMKAVLNPFISSLSGLTAELDGKPITGVASYRVTTGSFSYTLPERNVFQYFGSPISPGTVAPAVADGYYLMLAPLSKGAHTLHFKGGNANFVQDITYHLTVN